MPSIRARNRWSWSASRPNPGLQEARVLTLARALQRANATRHQRSRSAPLVSFRGDSSGDATGHTFASPRQKNAITGTASDTVPVVARWFVLLTMRAVGTGSAPGAGVTIVTASLNVIATVLQCTVPAWHHSR